MRIPVLLIIPLLLAASVPATHVLAAETAANATQEQTFTLSRGETLSAVCSRIRAAGTAIAIPDCVKQILFVNRQWFDENFGYVWKDPDSVNLDSAIRLWAGVAYQMPAEFVQANLQGVDAQNPAGAANPTANPIHPGHFDPKGKPPSKYTIEVLKQAQASLPFSDTRDFAENRKGLIAQMPDLQIKADAGNVAWDMEAFQFLDQKNEFDSINPSLHRIGQLNNNYGLYEVVPGIYQVRGFDLSQLTFIRGKTGWIVFDPLVSAETARAGLKLFQEHVGKGLPVTAVIYSHDHADHWGGVRGVVDEADVRAGKVEIIAPNGFMDALVS
ncbi:MAG TPA: MBL fold metallo-hydrolase, partial [Candidatus Competibacteraceae bacterium]|nr:MBL fold metallo-hydrolase [Candidatus Competibacteraceae bacterium]